MFRVLTLDEQSPYSQVYSDFNALSELLRGYLRLCDASEKVPLLDHSPGPWAPGTACQNPQIGSLTATAFSSASKLLSLDFANTASESKNLICFRVRLVMRRQATDSHARGTLTRAAACSTLQRYFVLITLTKA